MRDYGKVHTSFWTSASIREMSEDGRALALYLLTCPHSTIAGVFRLPDGYVCEDLQWSPERVAKGFAELFQKGFANRCGTTKWVWVRHYLKWNPLENPNQRKAAAKVVATIPASCAWKSRYVSVCDESGVPAEEESWNPCGTLREPFLKQEQEQEQEQERAVTPAGSTRPASASGSRLPTDWSLPDDWRTWAVMTRADIDIDREAECFRDYWHAKAGKDARRTDWQATWRNWIRRAHAVPGQRNASREPATLPRLT